MSAIGAVLAVTFQSGGLTGVSTRCSPQHPTPRKAVGSTTSRIGMPRFHANHSLLQVIYVPCGDRMRGQILVWQETITVPGHASRKACVTYAAATKRRQYQLLLSSTVKPRPGGWRSEQGTRGQHMGRRKCVVTRSSLPAMPVSNLDMEIRPI